MPTCNRCGKQIVFRYVDGASIPIHPNGGCSGDSKSKQKSSTSGYFSLANTGDQQYKKACGEAKTYLTNCWWCREQVYYHTNGYNDHVLFDPPLGWPWYIHSCWQQHCDSKKEFERGLRKAGITTYQPQPMIQSLNTRKRKLIVLYGAYNSVKQKGLPTTDENIAKSLGISQTELYQSYQGLYEIYMENGLTLVRLYARPQDL